MTQPLPSDAHWKPLVVCPDDDLARRLVSALAALGFAEVPRLAEYPALGAMAAAAARHQANICFLDMCADQEHALLLVSESAPTMAVVSLNPQNDAEMMLRALRRGAADFLSDPSAAQVRTILDRLSAKHPAAGAGKSAVVCVVFPAKPGSGASTLAAQLASEMKRMGLERVLLADLDSMTGSIGFQLKLKSDFSIEDAAEDAARLDDDLWRRLTVACDGFDVLLAPADATPRIRLGQPGMLDLLRFLKPRYDGVILDLPGAAAALEMACVQAAQHLLLVTTNELAALHAARRSLEFLDRGGADKTRLRLIVNRYTPRTGLKRDDVRTALELDPYAVLSNDYDAVQNAILEGKPVAKGTPFSRAVNRLAVDLCGEPPAAPAAPRRGGWLSLLGRKK
ncbi:MAG: cellulose synthase operon protein YhjQ/BcsQ [Bryobacteraceae bacterium]|jgi:pilus assembly protein CpaE